MDRQVVSNWKSNDLDSSVNSILDAKAYKCVNWTKVETVATVTPIAKEGQISGPELLNVSDFIKIHNSNIFPAKNYFGTTYSRMNICTNSDSSANLCVPKFGPWPSNSFAMAPKLKTIACRIQKSMSTVLDNLICYLYDEKAFRACKYKNFATNESDSVFIRKYVVQSGEFVYSNLEVGRTFYRYRYIGRTDIFVSRSKLERVLYPTPLWALHERLTIRASSPPPTYSCIGL
ncbi:hypothetical protein DdX_18912 [Ditylenchus destructor]|uniref:Uncharacterized protein n=1 Tax=Ditylenchus destructor TaxID=166010 RepID=A0AAD4MKN6_9BILA|nr:hypothetical protein DdX_18912 [Ditylenchus destructor]